MYRREAITDLKGEKYDACMGALNALNAMLPQEYRVVISTIDYNKMMQEGLFAACNFCTEESDFKDVRKIERLLSFNESVITGKSKDEFWVCSKCNRENKTTTTKFKNKIFKEPYYLKVVPNPPVRMEGMMTRTKFHKQFSNWFWSALGEIEAQLAQFRDDNWKKPGSLYDLDEDLGDTGEDKY